VDDREGGRLVDEVEPLAAIPDTVGRGRSRVSGNKKTISDNFEPPSDMVLSRNEGVDNVRV
jgi:hypothetical protein